MSGGVWIGGIGIISAIGNNVAETLESLEAGRSGVGEMQYLRSAHRGVIPVAEVPRSNESLAASAQAPAWLSRTALLSLIAARETLDSAGWQLSPVLRSGFISANTVGGMDKTEQFYRYFMQNPASGRLRDVVHHESGSITEVVAERIGMTGYVSTVSTACSSSANSILLGARMICQGMLDVALAGGVDALTAFTLNGFNTLMILDREPCRPFDQNRAGLNLGEGAGYVLLFSEKALKTLGIEPLCRLGGWHNATDAYHQTASSPEGTGSYLAMTGALAKAGLSPADIDYINVHGTGTPNNDQSEGRALRRVFGEYCPPFSSTKAFTGHTLGGSGGVEAVLSVLSVQQGLIYPNLRFTTPIEGLGLVPETVFRKGEGVRHVLSNSFGFGGNCTSLVFSEG